MTVSNFPLLTPTFGEPVKTEVTFSDSAKLAGKQRLTPESLAERFAGKKRTERYKGVNLPQRHCLSGLPIPAAWCFHRPARI